MTVYYFDLIVMLILVLNCLIARMCGVFSLHLDSLHTLRMAIRGTLSTVAIADGSLPASKPTIRLNIVLILRLLRCASRWLIIFVLQIGWLIAYALLGRHVDARLLGLLYLD